MKYSLSLNADRLKSIKEMCNSTIELELDEQECFSILSQIFVTDIIEHYGEEEILKAMDTKSILSYLEETGELDHDRQF